MKTSAQVVGTSVNVITNSPAQDYTHPDDHTSPTSDMTSGFKPSTILGDVCTWIEPQSEVRLVEVSAYGRLTI